MIDLQTAPLLTHIKQAGQQYLDEPVYLTSRAKPIAVGVCNAVGHPVPKDLHEIISYTRVPLRWVNGR